MNESHSVSHCNTLRHTQYHTATQHCVLQCENERDAYSSSRAYPERWWAGVETQKNVQGEIGGWGRVPLNETYAPSLSTIYDGA